MPRAPTVTGTPWLVRPLTGLRGPKAPVPGRDFAGTVEAVGANVDHAQPGDEVYGAGRGSLAELMCAGQGVAMKPANLSFAEAAAVPIAGVTAL
jgi:NADPH:quinone reductase-like Zn-dependent oxidoreductase